MMQDRNGFHKRLIYFHRKDAKTLCWRASLTRALSLLVFDEQEIVDLFHLIPCTPSPEGEWVPDLFFLLTTQPSLFFPSGQATLIYFLLLPPKESNKEKSPLHKIY
jgi:hypothetical protein